MSDSIVAYRYAKALYDFAVEQGVVNEVNEDMKLFNTICDENPEFTATMANPIIRHSLKNGILDKIFKSRINKVTYAIFDVLTKKNREKLIYPISNEFLKIYNQNQGILNISVVSASALTDDQRKDFSKIVANSTNKVVNLEEKIDASLIGGYILRIGDTQIDTSVRKKLNKLKLAFA